MVRTVGVVGVGIMGTAMASNLLDAGFDVVVHDVAVERSTALAAEGSRAVAAAGDVARASDVVITSLPSTRALEEVTADDALPAGCRRGLVVVETSTLPLAAKERARERIEAAGATMLDCPFSGTGRQARVRDLAVYASGDELAIRECQPVFDGIARVTHHVGTFGTGSRMKFVANLLVSIHNVATAEAFVLARRAGLDPETVYDVVRSGAGTSTIFEARWPIMAAGSYDEPTASVQMFLKDIDTIRDFAGQVGAPTPLLTGVLPYYLAAHAQGHGTDDAAAVCAVLEQGMAGDETV
ncbi:NAD(P)-dependent oxidoreductase [Actinobacteria bacterium YIM 96077]|uniref:NAD(P)-dependent oxidoreductase n=1 Tax=Phytoactinopolyspora halophila TaxID=1981511 RepID=A0A329QSX9_9ACTN|nr:NAD(P)-dependent oxidoreductase [Phytoactinopolyspora halophila]AYY12285.1 NAD(P)-dependent oxidoreductase [Actinobacteria bacterium YIM 96077]RAW13798.1 NAD(P)-dependent oxidoreductase [Phytoactinopolyspora halophila]